MPYLETLVPGVFQGSEVSDLFQREHSLILDTT